MRYVDVHAYGLHPQTVRENGFCDLERIVPGVYIMVRAGINDYGGGVEYFTNLINISPGDIESISDNDGQLSFSCLESSYDCLGQLSLTEVEINGHKLKELFGGGDGLSPTEDLFVVAMIPLYGWDSAAERAEPAIHQTYAGLKKGGK